MDTASTVAALAPADTHAAGDVLARAFHNDPGTVWTVPDEDKRRRQLPWFFRGCVRYGQRYGEAYALGAGVEGAAVWLPPGKTQARLLRFIRAGLGALPLKLGAADFLRLFRTLSFLEQLHKRDAPPDHWYLWVLGVDTGLQGRGLGSALIQPVLARADRDGLSCYLETAKEINVRFYRKHGFEVVAEGDLPGGGPPYWTMRRDPIR